MECAARLSLDMDTPTEALGKTIFAEMSRHNLNGTLNKITWENLPDYERQAYIEIAAVVARSTENN